MIDKKEVYCGDKFVITVNRTLWSPNDGNSFLIKEIPNLVLRDEDIDKLKKYKEPPKEMPHSCEFCKYENVDEYEMPCAICDKNGVAPKDMFEAKDGE